MKQKLGKCPAEWIVRKKKERPDVWSASGFSADRVRCAVSGVLESLAVKTEVNANT